jgi:hypothetical protein
MFYNLVRNCLFYVLPYALAYLKTFITYVRIGLLFKILLEVYLLLKNHISALLKQILNFFCKISINVVNVILYLATFFCKSCCNYYYKTFLLIRSIFRRLKRLLYLNRWPMFLYAGSTN